VIAHHARRGRTSMAGPACASTIRGAARGALTALARWTCACGDPPPARRQDRAWSRRCPHRRVLGATITIRWLSRRAARSSSRPARTRSRRPVEYECAGGGATAGAALSGDERLAGGPGCRPTWSPASRAATPGARYDGGPHGVPLRRPGSSSDGRRRRSAILRGADAGAVGSPGGAAQQRLIRGRSGHPAPGDHQPTSGSCCPSPTPDPLEVTARRPGALRALR